MHTSLFVAIALALPYTTVVAQIDADSVPLATRDQWCNAQVEQCPLICTQTNDGSAATDSNDCDPSTLQYSCVCGNGIAPNASEYSLTVPYFICTQVNENCKASCGGSNTCQTACVQNHPCGAQNPSRVNATSAMSSTTSATSTATGISASGTKVYTDFAGSSPTSSSESGSGSAAAGSGAARIVAVSELYGLGVVMIGVFAGFGLLL